MTHRKSYGVLDAETRNWDVIDYLHQTEIWKDAPGRFLYMGDFTDRSLSRLVSWLVDEAAHLQVLAVAKAWGRDDAERIEALSPGEWLREQPLYNALTDETVRRVEQSLNGLPVIQYGEPGEGSTVMLPEMLPTEATLYLGPDGETQITMPLSAFLREVRGE